MHPVPCCERATCSPEQYYLLKIKGIGKLVRQAYRYLLPIDHVPCGFESPFTLRDVRVSGEVQWQPIPCRNPYLMAFQVRIPLTLSLTDCRGRPFCASSYLQEEMHIRLQCPAEEMWRYTFQLHAAVRQSCRCNLCSCTECAALLDVCVDAYLLSPTCTSVPDACTCCDQRPWYPSLPCK